MGNAIGLLRQLIESYFDEVWNTAKANLLNSKITRSYFTYSPGPMTEGSNSASFENRKGFADLNYEIRDLVITDNKIVANIVLTGTQLKALWASAKFKIETQPTTDV